MSDTTPVRAAWYFVERVPQQDIGRQLGLIGRGSWAMFALFVAITFTLAWIFGQPTTSTPAGIAVLISLSLAAGLIASPSLTPLPMWRTALIIVIVVAAIATISGLQPFHDRPPGKAAWELGSCNLLLFGLALRQRVVAAWLGELAMLGALSIWSTLVTGSPLYGLSFSYGQPVSLVAGTVFAVALHRAAKRIIEVREAEQLRAAAEARAIATSTVHDADLRLVRDLAQPTLRQIVAGANPEPREVRAIEAALRDLIRGRSLAIEPLVSGLRRARLRGADVVLLDDLGEISVDHGDLRRAASWCADIVDTLNSDSITIRIVGSATASVVTIADDSAELNSLTIACAAAGRNSP